MTKITKSGSISRRRLLTTVSAGAALAVSPFRINLLQAQEATIKIGFPVPLTGPYGTEAQDQVRAGQLAVAQFNDAGGLNGRKAELVVRDDKLNPGEAATRTLELVEKEKVNFVVGSLSAAVQLAITSDVAVEVEGGDTRTQAVPLSRTPPAPAGELAWSL